MVSKNFWLSHSLEGRTRGHWQNEMLRCDKTQHVRHREAVISDHIESAATFPGYSESPGTGQAWMTGVVAVRGTVEPHS